VDVFGGLTGAVAAPTERFAAREFADDVFDLVARAVFAFFLDLCRARDFRTAGRFENSRTRFFFFGASESDGPGQRFPFEFFFFSGFCEFRAAAALVFPASFRDALTEVRQVFRGRAYSRNGEDRAYRHE